MYLYIRDLNTPRIWVDIEANMLYDTSRPLKMTTQWLTAILHDNGLE